MLSFSIGWGTSRRAFLALSFGALLVAAGCGGSPSGASGDAGGGGSAGGTLQIKGSDTMVNLGQAWAEVFMERNAGAQIAVTGGGSGTGIAALLNGTTDIAQSSRTIKDEETEQARQRGLSLHEVQVGIDGLTVAVHPRNPVKQLTIAQLSDIFTGKVTNWSQVGGSPGKIVAFSREKNSGTHVFFLEEVVRQGNAKGSEEFAPGILMLPSSNAIADQVAQDVNAIGYFGMGYFDATKHKAVPVGKAAGGPFVAPSPESAGDGSYVIARPLMFYMPKAPEALTARFIEFVQSAEGQRIVQEQEFVPLKTASSVKPVDG
jgi:phosphate transport system substrate-binding protein